MYEERIKKLEERQVAIGQRGAVLNKEAQSLAGESRDNNVRIATYKEAEEDLKNARAKDNLSK